MSSKFDSKNAREDSETSCPSVHSKGKDRTKVQGYRAGEKENSSHSQFDANETETARRRPLQLVQNRSDTAQPNLVQKFIPNDALEHLLMHKNVLVDLDHSQFVSEPGELI